MKYIPNEFTRPTVKSDLTLRQLADIDETAGSQDRIDNIRNNQILVSLVNIDRPRTFSFHYISDILQGGAGITIATNSNGITTISNTGVTKIIAGSNITISPVSGLGDVTINSTVGYTPENTANKQNSLAVDGTGVKFPTVDAVNNLSFIDKGKAMISFFTDFISAGSATPNLVTVNAGTGSTTNKSTTTAAPNQTVNQIGICQYQTGTTATGWISHVNDNQGALAFTFGGGAWVYETFIEVDTLSTLTEQFRFITGFATQSSVANEVNAIIFTYDSAGIRNGTIASPNWQCVTSDNSTRTLTTTAVAVTTTWTKLRIEVNAAATSVTFYINGTLVATHTTNIPTFANSRFLIMKQQLVKSAGTTNRSVYCDYLGYENILTTPR